MTPIGYIAFLAGVAGLFLSQRWLYRSFVFWTLFSATSAANFGGDENGSALQVWMVFGSFWLLRLILNRVSKLEFMIDGRIVGPCLWLIRFAGVATISLLMPLWINGDLLISSPILGEDSSTPLYLTSHHFTQLLYLVFGILIAICVAHANLSDEQQHDTERVILCSAIFVAAWGGMQFACNLTGFHYPAFLFNNSGSAFAKGYLQTLDIGINRVSSVAVEPSVLAQSLVVLLPLCLPAWLNRGSVLSRWMDRSASILLVAALVISTSSTAYLGLFLLGISAVVMIVRSGALSIRRVAGYAAAALVGTCAVVAMAVTNVPVVSNLANSVLLNKSSSGSGIERLMTIGLALGYFQQYPILGIGWGSATSHDLIAKLLSNVGILGFAVFAGAMAVVMRASWRNLGDLTTPSSLSRFAWLLGFTVYLLTSVLIGFPLVFGNFWLMLGMAVATGCREDILAATTSPARSR